MEKVICFERDQPGRANGLFCGPALRVAAVLAAVPLLCVAAGCNVTTHTNTNTGGADVSVDTPLGGVHVKSDPSAVLAKVGLPAYPGAQAVAEQGKDKDAADVNLNFGSFHLQVLAAGLQTNDTPAQVEAFYRKALLQYSDVIACRNQQPVGLPAKTGMGLTCSDDKHTHMGSSKDGDRKDELELKAGSPTRQHIVAVKPKGSVTRMELIALELPKDSGGN